MDLRDVPESKGFQLPPVGRYPAKFTSAEAATSSSGNPMVKWELECQWEDRTFRCWGQFMTSGATGGGSITRKELRALGPALGFNVDNDVVEDEKLAELLLGLECFVDIKYEAKKEMGDSGKYVQAYDFDDTGKRVASKKVVVKSFHSHDAGGSSQGQGVAPQTQVPYGPPQTQAPQQFAQPQMPPAYQQAPQTQQPIQQFQPPQPQQPVHYTQPGPMQAPQGAVPPWMQQPAQAPQQAPQVQPAPVVSEGQATRGRKAKQ